MKRVVIAGVLGGVALFLWGSVRHLASGLGAIGIQEIPNEQGVLNGMTASIKAPGLYLFPGTGLGAGATHEQQPAARRRFNKRRKRGRNGILVIHPNGGGGFTAARLTNEFVLNVVQALLLAGILAWAGAPGSYVGRVAFGTVVGLFGALATNVQYWNWYGFPTDYTLAYILGEAVGFFVVGRVKAAIVKR